jgi:pimeloyl-ACP methyl ester carboxylesterase
LAAAAAVQRHRRQPGAFQPFVDALDPQRAVIRFDMPGIGGSLAPVVPYHLVTLPSLLTGLLDQLGYEQADVLGIS